MAFRLIGLARWERREYYEHFINQVVCTYSTTVNIDITPLDGHRLYPAMIWLLTRTVNTMPEFRTALSKNGPGIYDRMNPAYTVFNKEGKNFSRLWLEYTDSYPAFLAAYEANEKTYTLSRRFSPRKGTPDNTFDISMIPWFTFTAFDINVFDEGKYLLPIFTMGKHFMSEGRRMLPLAIQVHHAVCDGYHVGLFITRLQEMINEFGRYSGRHLLTGI